jgi:hypothetical protein
MRNTLAVIALAAAACGKQTFLAAAFVQTPALPNPLDPGKPFPQFQVITAYFGTIDTSDPTKIDPGKLAPVKDALASVSFHHKSSGPGDVDEDRYICAMGSPGCTKEIATSAWSITSSSTGAAYVLNSSSEKRLTFESGTPYTLALITPGADGDAFGARLTPGPVADMQEFADASATCTVTPPIGNPIVTKRCIQTSLGRAAMTIHRTDAPVNGQRLPAFLVVVKIDPNNPTKNLDACLSVAPQENCFKTIPADATALLKYVLSDVPYRWSSYNIPETAFLSAGYYIVALLTVNSGKVSSNAFLGSTALAAAGAAGIVIVQ